jgi:hypothetical protein
VKRSNKDSLTVDTPISKLCHAILAVDKLVQRSVLQDNDGKQCADEEQAVIDVLCGYFGEKLDISEEKEEYIIEASLISADLRRVVCGDQVGMVALQELLTVQDGGFLKRKKVAEACA